MWLVGSWDGRFMSMEIGGCWWGTRSFTPELENIQTSTRNFCHRQFLSALSLHLNLAKFEPARMIEKGLKESKRTVFLSGIFRGGTGGW